VVILCARSDDVTHSDGVSHSVITPSSSTAVTLRNTASSLRVTQMHRFGTCGTVVVTSQLFRSAAGTVLGQRVEPGEAAYNSEDMRDVE
jgi:hypothetical protein